MEFTAILPEELLGSLNDVERKHAPAELYLAGHQKMALPPKVSIVGTRTPTVEGIALTARIVRAFCAQNVCIVSGLAAGIDAVAHRTALAEGGRTVAVLGTPLDQFYPRANMALQKEIIAKQLALSQFPKGSVVTRKNFPLRNRTMALISDATIIIEANAKSGTEHQGWEALRLGRPLFVTEQLAKNSFPWVEKLMHYGAQVLVGEEISPVLELIPTALMHEANSAAL